MNDSKPSEKQDWGDGAMSKKICPICGYQDEENVSYCRECGAKMVESRDNAWSAYEQKGQYSSYQENTSQSAASGNGFGQSGQYNNYQDYTSNSNIPYQHGGYDLEPDNATNGLQIAGLVCGILSICLCCCYGVPSVVLGIAGIICASMGNKNSKNGVGTAGMVCSIIGLILGVLAIIYYAMVISQIVNSNYYDYFDFM